MKRVEIILTQAIEQDFVDMFNAQCKKEGIKPKFTKIDNVMGQGNTSPKMGDPIWPQLNTMFVIYCDDKVVSIIKDIMKNLHKEYIGEGAASFVSDADIIL